MVGAAAADDAVRRARRLPSLRVGLHLVTVRGLATLAQRDIPQLVDRQGRFSDDLLRAGVRYFFCPGLRRQLEAEIRAQFEAFCRTGLALDHVNAHNHMHLHPTLLSLILKVGADYGLAAVRIPYEPALQPWLWRQWRRRLGNGVFLAPWIALMKKRLAGANVFFNQRVFGMNDHGDMNEARVLYILAHMPNGVTEIYFHPSCAHEDAGRREFEALTSPAVAKALYAFGIQKTSFTDLIAMGASQPRVDPGGRIA